MECSAFLIECEPMSRLRVGTRRITLSDDEAKDEFELCDVDGIAELERFSVQLRSREGIEDVTVPFQLDDHRLYVRTAHRAPHAVVADRGR